MLSSKSLKLLLIAFVLCVVAIYTLIYRTGEIVVLSKTELLLPDLDPKQVAKVQLKNRDLVLTFYKDDGEWKIIEKYGYPVVHDKVEEVVYNIADFSVVEPKTTNSKYYKLLNVDDPTTEGSNAVLITLEDQHERELAQLIIGKREALRVFVRNPKDEQTWLVQGFVDLSMNLQDWVAQPLLGVIDEDQIRQVMIKQGKNEVSIKKANKSDQDFVLKGVAITDKLDTNAVNTLPYEIAEIGYIDVIPRADLDISWDKAINVNLDTFDRGTLRLDIVRVDSKVYAKSESEPGWYYQLAPETYALLTVVNDDFILQP